MAKARVYITEQRRVEFEVPDRPEDYDSEWIADILDKAQAADGEVIFGSTNIDVYYDGKQVY